MPTFARPLNDRPAIPALSSPFLPSPVVTALALTMLSCAALFLVARPNGAQNLPTGKSGATGHKPPAVVSKNTASGAGTGKETSASGAHDRQGLDFYTSNVRDGMFSAPQPPRLKPPTPHVDAPVKPPPVIKVPLMVINPFAEWSYTGTVHMGDITMALLENTRTKEGQYVKSGDGFMGAQVQGITDQMVTLTNAGKPTLLAKADTIVITPLNQNAPGANPPAQAGPPQNGQPPINLTMPAQMGSSPQSITLPNGRVLNGDRAQRYKDRLDRGFGGGNGGGGGNNGGGGNRRGGNGG